MYSIRSCLAQFSGNAADHNLDLSLGGSASKQNNLELGDDSQVVTMDQHSVGMSFEADWRSRGFRPKVLNRLILSAG